MGRRTPRLADESEPTMDIPLVVGPIEIGLALIAVPPAIRHMPIAREHLCEKLSVPPSIEGLTADLQIESDAGIKFLQFLEPSIFVFE